MLFVVWSPSVFSLSLLAGTSPIISFNCNQAVQFGICCSKSEKGPLLESLYVSKIAKAVVWTIYQELVKIWKPLKPNGIKRTTLSDLSYFCSWGNTTCVKPYTCSCLHPGFLHLNISLRMRRLVWFLLFSSVQSCLPHNQASAGFTANVFLLTEGFHASLSSQLSQWCLPTKTFPPLGRKTVPTSQLRPTNTHTCWRQRSLSPHHSIALMGTVVPCGTCGKSQLFW